MAIDPEKMIQFLLENILKGVLTKVGINTVDKGHLPFLLSLSGRLHGDQDYWFLSTLIDRLKKIRHYTRNVRELGSPQRSGALAGGGKATRAVLTAV